MNFQEVMRLFLQILQSLASIFIFFTSVDQSKEATFKVAPSKWEAVDEAELQAQGELELCVASKFIILLTD